MMSVLPQGVHGAPQWMLSAALGLALAVGGVGCSSTTVETSTPAAAASASVAGDEASAFTITDAWVKASDEMMTAAFGVLSNDGDADIRIVGASSDAAGMLELHEVVKDDDGEMKMQEKDGGFVIPAHSEHTLQPGADHLMLMHVADPIVAGQEVTITLTFEDGSSADFTATAKEFSGANETYE